MSRHLSFALVFLAGTPVLGQDFNPPPPKAPDTDTRTKINDGTSKLRAAVERAAARLPAIHQADLQVYVKAAEWIVAHQEWHTAASGKQTLAVIDQGIQRAESVGEGRTPWLEQPRGAVARGYRSQIDDSVQPYGVVYPPGYGEDRTRKYRLDIHLHGRDSTLTEIKHLYQHSGKDAPKGQGFVQINIYGRGNNAYRWAGEVDVFEAMHHFLSAEKAAGRADLIDGRRIVLKGFSMGGAGTWQIGLRHPDRFAVLQPGAGFTRTHGYVPKLPEPLPPQQEACLTIYDAYRYAENAFNVPIVAYSGAKDRQKLAADSIHDELVKLKLDRQMIHVVAPDLEHKFPPEWQQKVDAIVRQRGGDTGRNVPNRVRFVTYTLRSNRCDWVTIQGLGKHYERASVDASRTPNHLAVETKNVTAIEFGPFSKEERPRTLSVDHQNVAMNSPVEGTIVVVRTGEKWAIRPTATPSSGKRPGVQGPIDDAFTGPFLCVVGTGKPLHPAMHQSALAQLERFRREWNKWMRGDLPVKNDTEVTETDRTTKNLILFGDPGSNALIAKTIPGLPITWDARTLEMNGQKYDPASHLPVLIHPGPFGTDRYVVLNSGHTFHESEFRGTNALLFPRLGDFAVLKPKPTDKEPAAAEVISAGLFDDHWKFTGK